MPLLEKYGKYCTNIYGSYQISIKAFWSIHWYAWKKVKFILKIFHPGCLGLGFFMLRKSNMKEQLIHICSMFLNDPFDGGREYGIERLIIPGRDKISWWLKIHPLNPAIVPGFFLHIGFGKECGPPTQNEENTFPSIDGWLREGQNGHLLRLESGWRPQAGFRLSCDVLEKLQLM